MFYWFTNYSREIVLHTSMPKTEITGVSLFLGGYFSMDLFPQIVIPCNHAAPYHDPRTGLEAPFLTVGPFMSTDTLFPSTAGDLDLFTDEEVYALSRVGALKSPITITSNPHVSTPASRMEPDSSTRKRSQRDSLRCRCPMSSATGSAEDLDKSEYERSTEPKRITGDGRGVAPKHGISVDRGFSGERPHPKERWAERDRSHERRCPTMPECPQPPLSLLAPGAPSRPTTGSLRAPIQGPNKGHIPLGRSGDTDVPVSSVGPVASSRSLQLGYTSGQGLVTSGLTPAQSEEIFL